MEKISPLKVILFTVLVLPTAGLLFKLGLTIRSPALASTLILIALVQIVPERSEARGITQIIGFVTLALFAITMMVYVPDGLSLTLKPWLGFKLLILAGMYGIGHWLIFSASINDDYGKGEIIVFGFVVGVIFLGTTHNILKTLTTI